MISIPSPCTKDWAAMRPTEAGRHCATCATEVVDFTRLSEAEILAFMARQGGQRVCARTWIPLLAAPLPASRWRRWLVAGLALLGWSSASAHLPGRPLPPPVLVSHNAIISSDAQRVVISGRVLDGNTKEPVAGVDIFINDTEFGTTTDGQGNFKLVMACSWKLIAGGKLALKFVGNSFTFQEQVIRLDVRATPRPTPLLVRLVSQSNRGQIVGEVALPIIPVAPPKG